VHRELAKKMILPQVIKRKKLGQLTHGSGGSSKHLQKIKSGGKKVKKEQRQTKEDTATKRSQKYTAKYWRGRPQ